MARSSGKPTVYVADDDPDEVALLEYYLQQWGYRAGTAADKSQLLQLLDQEIPSLLLLDLRFGEHDGVELLAELFRRYQGLRVIMLTAHASVSSAVSAIKFGAVDYLTKPPDFEHLRVIVEQVVSAEQQPAPTAAAPVTQSRRMIGSSSGIQEVYDLISNVASTDATVFVLGETGTGKELVAREVHNLSERRSKPFVPVNMAALPHELAESTLFGHEKGSFTGADRTQVGCCEAADGGTLFLDEIGEMDLNLQAKLLRFVQEQTVTRVGAAKPRQVDVRIVAATNRDPLQAVQDGLLREDLYYRLNVVPVQVPPLRERRSDIPELVTAFIAKASERHRRSVTGISDSALRTLKAYDWPGNVRQLENLIERLVVLSKEDIIQETTLPKEVRRTGSEAATAPEETETSAPRRIDEIERQAILDALEASDGNVGEAATALGLGQATVYRKMKRFGIERPSRRKRSSG